MPCIPVPVPAFPEILAPFSLIPTLPAIPGLQEGVCCQAINLGSPHLPFPLPPLILNPGIVQVMRKGMDVVRNYLRSLPIECPRE